MCYCSINPDKLSFKRLHRLSLAKPHAATASSQNNEPNYPQYCNLAPAIFNY